MSNWQQHVRREWLKLKEQTSNKEDLPKFTDWVKTLADEYKKSNAAQVTDKSKKSKVKVKKSSKEQDEESADVSADELSMRYEPHIQKKIFSSHSTSLSIPEMFSNVVLNNLDYQEYLGLTHKIYDYEYDTVFAKTCFDYANRYYGDILILDPMLHFPIYLHNKTLRLSDRVIHSRDNTRLTIQFFNQYLSNRNIRFNSQRILRDVDFVIINSNFNVQKHILDYGATLTYYQQQSGMIVKTTNNIGNNLSEFFQSLTIDHYKRINKGMKLSKEELETLVNSLYGRSTTVVDTSSSIDYNELTAKLNNTELAFNVISIDEVDNETETRTFKIGDFVIHKDKGWISIIEKVTKEKLFVVDPTKERRTATQHSINKFGLLQPVEQQNIDFDTIIREIKYIGSTKSPIDIYIDYNEKMGYDVQGDLNIRTSKVGASLQDLYNELRKVFNCSQMTKLYDNVYFFEFN